MIQFFFCGLVGVGFAGAGFVGAGLIGAGLFMVDSVFFSGLCIS